ncbi:MAG: hypothetical protein K8S62_08050 [Candidatus Sabulitectum sp.]|nr:hypothetical protein [Candidatus Sabulitectum sp.]
MISKWVLPGLLSAVAAYGSSVFTEATELWAEIDRINIVLESSEEMDTDVLEELFQETVETALSLELSQQFEDLRTDAFQTGNYDEINKYADRAAYAITVMLLGESNAIGVNTITFLDRSAPESEAYAFFLLAIGGFYTDGDVQNIGTAELPAWMERAGSSAQAQIDPVKAAEWLGYWQSMRPLLDGYFLTIADQTILELGASLE